DLPKPDPGSLFLTFAPLPAGGVLFARDINGVSSHRKEGRQPFAEWPHQVGSALKGANRVRVVVVDGATRNPHVAPWRGRPLLLQRTVVFGLDLPSSFPEPRAPDRQALIVSDPQENLPGARHELSTVAPLLKARGYDVRALKGAEAELQTVHEALRASTHFHYAGHAEDAADAPAHDGLRLDGGTLSPGDVLALDTAPASVVLMGCQTLGENNGSGLGVAQSFLLAGAKWVLASGRNVDDQLAPRLSEALYASPERDLDDAFARAARILHVEGDAGWRAFQVWVR
ncbi:MAG: CHAT domain-containing protein, partial [Myxococcota bacterium]